MKLRHRLKKEERKKSNEEGEKEKGEEVEMHEFVSDKAYEVMDKKMLKKDFIGERGFKQLISPFKEVIEKRRWSLLCEHKSVGYVALV